MSKIFTWLGHVFLACVSLFIPKKKGRVVYGEWFGKTASKETWSIFIEKNHDYNNNIWVTKNLELIEKISSLNNKITVVYGRTFRAIWYQLTAETVYINVSSDDLTRGAIRSAKNYIQLGHGIPLKKFLLLEDRGIFYKIKLVVRNILFDNYTTVICPFEEYAKMYALAYGVSMKKITIKYPDYLSNLKFSVKRNANSNTIYYMPTHRFEGKKFESSHIESFIKSVISAEVLDYYQIIIKLHPYEDKYVDKVSSIISSMGVDENKIKAIKACDFNLISALENSELLVTDYSGVFHEFSCVGVKCILFQLDRDIFGRDTFLPPGVKNGDVCLTEESLTIRLKVEAKK